MEIAAEVWLVSEQTDKGWRLRKIIKVHRVDVTPGQTIHIAGEDVTATADDFLFVVGYAVSDQFDSVDSLKQAVKDRTWKYEVLCEVRRTVDFPSACRFLRFEDVSKEEKNAFNAWRKDFESGVVALP